MFKISNFPAGAERVGPEDITEAVSCKWALYIYYIIYMVVNNKISTRKNFLRYDILYNQRGLI